MSDLQRPVWRLRPKTAATRFVRGDPWVFADELVMDRRTKNTAPGAIVELQDADRKPFALAAANPNSKIAARILDFDTYAVIDKAWIATRIACALELRERLFDAPFYRLIHAEADGLPGVVVDRFGDTLAFQPNAAWSNTLAQEFAEALVEVTGCACVYLNGSGRSRTVEGLEPRDEVLIGQLSGPVEVPMNGATYLADIATGQKTGLFYDQRANHAFAARLADGARVLDVFSHVGGFALAALKAGATSALAVDGSEPALTLAAKGAEASGVTKQFETRQGDGVKTMKALAEANEKFDVVICDPPAFAPNKGALEHGLRGYERVALHAAPLVERGGFLVLCSCSHAADLSRFRDASLRGIGRARRRVQLVHTGQATPDHPTHPRLAESSYLKALFFRVIE